MKDTRFDVDQVAELHRIERARMRRGQPGLRGEVAELIARLTSGGVGAPDPAKRRKGPKLPDCDPRILKQAKVLWDKGWGQRLGKSSFAGYLLDIPEIPSFFAGYDNRFPHLVLVDQRIQVVEACSMLGVAFDGVAFAPYDEMTSVKPLVYWMRAQDGKAYRNHKPSVCRTQFVSYGDEFGLNAIEGLALYAQYPDLLQQNAAWDLPGSVLVIDRAYCAFLKRSDYGDVELKWNRNDNASPRCGSASRRGCIA